MYRIELAPGEETALRTLDELATGIRNGIITSRARIWHNAGRKWLPIEFHPHYQAALKLLETARSPLPGEAHTSHTATVGAPTVAAPGAPTVIAAMPVQPLEPLSTPSPTPPPAADPVTPAEPATPMPDAASAASAGSATPAGSADRQRSALRPIGLLAGGIVMIVGAQMVASATSPGAEAGGAPTIAAAATATPVSAPVPAQAAVTPVAVVTPVDTATPVTNTVPGGGVVRGPVAHGPETPLPLAEPAWAASQPDRAEEESDTLPAIPPAPAIGDLSLPALPIDNP
jgi:hypothetical protein